MIANTCTTTPVDLFGHEPPPPDTPLNPFQQVAAETYGDGDYSYIDHYTDWRTAIDDCEDTLFTFVMIELSSKEGCMDFDEAINRLHSAQDDLAEVITALETRAAKEDH